MGNPNAKDYIVHEGKFILIAALVGIVIWKIVGFEASALTLLSFIAGHVFKISSLREGKGR